ncbi:hypothetical protein Tco_0477875 [Tanacetum coccineum]
MSMTIQSSVKDKILATSSKTSKVENTPAEMLRDLDQQMEKRADDGKVNAVTDALSRNERVKPRRVRAMAMIIQYGVRGMILAAQSEAFKLRWMIYLVVLADAAESVRDTIGFEYCLASSSGWTKSPVLWAEIRESSLTGPELVLDMTDKVVLVKENLKAARDRQKVKVIIRLNNERQGGDEEFYKIENNKELLHSANNILSQGLQEHEKGTFLDAEAKHGLADMKDSSAAAIMANLSSTSGTMGATTSQYEFHIISTNLQQVQDVPNERERESIEDFVKRFKGASKCTRISRFMHGITNLELITHLHDKIPKPVDEMMRTTTTFLKSRELIQGNEKDQPKVAKKGEASRKDKAMAILMVQPWQRAARKRVTQSFSLDPKILFPPLGDEDGAEGPMIIEAEIGASRKSNRRSVTYWIAQSEGSWCFNRVPDESNIHPLQPHVKERSDAEKTKYSKRNDNKKAEHSSIKLQLIVTEL